MFICGGEQTMSLNVGIISRHSDKERDHKKLERGKNENNLSGASSTASRPKHPIPIDFR